MPIALPSPKEFLRQAAWLADSARLRAFPPKAVPAAEEAPGRDRAAPRWLVLGYGAVGDTLFLLPALAGLRRAFPRGRFTFLANKSPITLELIPAAGVADEVLLADWEGVDERARRALNARLVAKRFDGVLVSLPSPAHFFREALASAALRVGHCARLAAPPCLAAPLRPAWLAKRALVTGELSRRLLLNRKAWIGPGPENAVARNNRLLDALGVPAAGGPVVPVPPSARAWAAAELKADPRRPLVAVHLGEPDNPYHKIWPPDRFGRICRRLRDEAGAGFILVGGAGEEPSAAAAKAAAGWDIPSWVGRCGLIETFALIERCGMFLGNDTGLAKAAMAMKVPAVTLWGPTDPAELGAWEAGAHRDIRLDLPCSPCVRLGMPYPKDGIDYMDCPHYRCMEALDEGMVFKEISHVVQGA